MIEWTLAMDQHIRHGQRYVGMELRRTLQSMVALSELEVMHADPGIHLFETHGDLPGASWTNLR